ncbi:MAG: hypothetical protein AB2A00_41635 [Myxococcota bacterium]
MGWTGGLVVTFLVLAQEPPPSSPAGEATPDAAPPTSTTPEAPALAVMPMAVRLGTGADNDASSLLTSALTAHLSATGHHRILGMDEIQALLENEAARQGVGCTDDGCLAEIAGALGARLVVAGEVEKVGRALQWTARLVDRQADAAVGRGLVTGGNVQELAAQAYELALQLQGRADEARLSGPAAQRRLGFLSAADLEDFRRQRERRPAASLSDVLTEYIIGHNRESRALAVGQAISFGLAAACLVPVLPINCVATQTGIALLPVTLGLFATSFLMGLSSAVATLVGVVLVVVDEMDPGRVPVSRQGCCRDDARIVDAERDRNLLRAAAMAVLLSGPMAFGVALGALAGVWAATALVPVGFGDEFTTFPVTLMATFGVPLCAVSTLCVTTPVVGAALLLKPDAPILEADAVPEVAP